MERVVDALDRPFPRLAMRSLPYMGERLVKFLDEVGDRRARRADEWFRTLSQLTGMTQHQILERAESDEELTETVAETFRAAILSPHAGKRVSLARVLAPALTDDAPIHEASHLARIIAALEPVHARVLSVLARTRSEPYDATERRAGRLVIAAWPEPLVAEALHSEPTVVEALLWQLNAQGLASDGTLAFDDGSLGWQLTAAGQQVLGLVESEYF